MIMSYDMYALMQKNADNALIWQCMVEQCRGTPLAWLSRKALRNWVAPIGRQYAALMCCPGTYSSTLTYPPHTSELSCWACEMDGAIIRMARVTIRATESDRATVKMQRHMATRQSNCKMQRHGDQTERL